MKLPRRQFLRLPAAALGILTTAILSHAAWSQTARKINIVVPFVTGGAGSVLAHLLADKIGEMQNLPTLVENRPGGGTAIGTEAVARAIPDGSTLLINNTAILINAHLRKQNYDPVSSFEPICNLVGVPVVLAVNSASPYRTLAEFLEAARARPGELTLANFTATGAHIALERLKRMANVDFTLIPYPGSAPAVTAVLGGHVTSILDNFATMGEHVNAGKMRALATFSRQRSALFPQIPTVAEAGYPEMDYEGWFGLFAPANVPKETVSQIAAWTTAAIQAPEMKPKLEALGLSPLQMCGADFKALILEQYEEFGRTIREANIKAE
jgi:tripartite-type tricarboxylate transporter receptor subunit TctC